MELLKPKRKETIKQEYEVLKPTRLILIYIANIQITLRVKF